MRAAKYSLAAAVAALAAIFLTGARAAESLQIEGGQIADAAPDASGIRVFKGIPYAAPTCGGVALEGASTRATMEWHSQHCGMGSALCPEQPTRRS